MTDLWIWIALYAVGALIAAFVIAYFFDEGLAAMSMFWPFLIPIGAVIGALMYAAHLGKTARERFSLKAQPSQDDTQ